jgi:general stress protein 26
VNLDGPRPCEGLVKLADRIHDLLATQRFAVLATSGESGPYTSLVAFAVNEDLSTLLFATLRSSTKYRNLCRNHDVSLFFDNRGATGGDPYKTETLMAAGPTAEPLSHDRSVLEELFLHRHPGFQAFLTSPDCALISVHVRYYLLVSRFDKKEILHMSPDARDVASR